MNERSPYHATHQDGTELDIEIPITVQMQLESLDPHTVVRARAAVCDLFRDSFRMHHGHEWKESHNDLIYWEQLTIEPVHAPAERQRSTSH